MPVNSAPAVHSGNSEVEQLGFTLLRHQNVRGFDVAMHDQVAVCMLHRIADLQQQLHACAHAETMRVAPGRDLFTGDIFESEVGRAIGAHAAVVQLRDVRVRQSREGVAFTQEALDQFRRGEFAANEFQRNLMSELPIGTFGQIHAAHSADTEFAQ